VAAFGSRTAAHTRGRHETPSARRLLALAALPTAATLVFEWSTGVTPSNPTRALAGAPLGAAVVWVIAKVIGHYLTPD
ncbi:MAG: hypothetical protein ACRD9W_09565, partial [Terriglobia bacterium]